MKKLFSQISKIEYITLKKIPDIPTGVDEV